MAYSTRPNNDFVLFNTTNNDNPNQLDVLFFSDFTQHGTMTSSGVPADGGILNFTSLFTTNTRSTTDQTDYGNTGGHGVVGINHTNGSSFHRYESSLLLNGIPEPAAGEVTCYEMEMGLRITTAQYASDQLYGWHRFGFWGTSSTNPSDGIYLEYWVNGVFDGLQGWYVDDTPIDGEIYVTTIKDGNIDRFTTGLAFNANELYRLYLRVERFPVGKIGPLGEVGEDNVYVSYEIKNKTLGTSTGYQITVPLLKNGNTPYASGDYMNMRWMSYQIGDGADFAGYPKFLIDYIGGRIRTPIKREILL